MQTPDSVARLARRAFQLGCMSTLLVGVATHARAFDGTAAPSGSSPFAILVTTAVIAAIIVGVMLVLRRAGHPTIVEGPPMRRSTPQTAPRAAKPAPRAAAVAAAPAPAGGKPFWPAPELELIPYDGVLKTFSATRADPVSAPALPAANDTPVAPKTTSLSDATRQRILERYIGARFTGVAVRGEDFLDAPRIVKAARLFFEDRQIERAVELLKLATEVNPAHEAPWLAMLEILFLGSDSAGYARAARRFASSHPASENWPVIRSLGRKLGLDDSVITQGLSHVERYPNYGPWQGLPNWIQAPWDLTNDAALAELHSRLKTDIAIANEQTRRRAA
jgi:hypothetical protein